MRVLQLGPYPPPHGGVQTNLVAIREYLRRRGIACAVINLTRHRRAGADQVYYPESPWQLLRLLLRLRYDVLHLHLGGDLHPRLVAFGLVCCSLPGKRAVLTFHSGGYPATPAGRHPDFWRRWMVRRFDALIAVNPEIAEFFGRCGAKPERVRVIEPHAILEPEAADLPEDLRRFYDAHDPVLLSVGQLEPEYDLPRQIEALGLVRERFPDAGLVLIGSGSLERELRERIAARAYAAHLLLPGDVAHAATLEAIRQCDVFLRTTLYDGDSISVREALYFGVPVIATDNGMRPPGCDLIAAPDTASLRAAIERRLTEGRAGTAPRREAGEENLKAVYEIYRALTG